MNNRMIDEQHALANEYFGRGKLLLFGEYTALFGGHALGISLPFRLVLRCESMAPMLANDDMQVLEKDGYFLYTKTMDEKLERAFVRFRDIVREKEELENRYSGRRHFYLNSNIPIGRGLGSSAALAAAFAGFLASGEERRRYALLFEHIFHGQASGIDSSIALQEDAKQLCIFSFNSEGDPPLLDVIPGDGLYLVVGSIEREQSAVELISRVLQEKPQIALSKLDAIASKAIDLVRNRAKQTDEQKREMLLSALGSCANEAHAELRTMQVDSNEQENLLKVGLDAGALGAKLSGAGGGGAFYYICKDKESALTIAEALANLPHLFIL